MKAQLHCFKSHHKLLVLVVLSIYLGLSPLNAQCPTVTNNTQSFCDIESILVGDLNAIDNGGGIVWYDTPISTTPLSNSEGLISGEDYYADDNTGSCGTRTRVDVIIYRAPTGSNFQGICLDDPSLATVANLSATGNDVQWYLTASGGTALPETTSLIDDTIYYADQANPDTGCRTSRLAVMVNVGVTPIPTGDTIQEFCASSGATPTVGDLVASGNNNWYISLFSALPLPSSTPLQNGQIYYATTLDLPCESSGRLAVIVILNVSPDPGTSAILELCASDTNTPTDLFTLLGGSPVPGGTWTPALNSGSGIFDPNVDLDGVYTYTLTSDNTCPDASSTVTVTTFEAANAGSNASLDLCSNDEALDLFSILGGIPDSGGTWSPALNSGAGIFDPAIDPQGIYTYSVPGEGPCDTASATVNVSVSPFNDAGEEGTLEICDDESSVDLFDSLGGTPDSGGTWSPALNSGTGIFNPLIDPEGIYTYTFSGTSICPESSATVTVTINELPDAGSNSTIQICSTDTETFDLFESLGGNPDLGGTWSPALATGTSVFDPAVDLPGTYTYTITGDSPCPNASATVAVSIITAPDAGLDASLNVCSNSGLIDLFDNLGGTPDVGGIWSPVLNSGSGVFDPEIDPGGIYTYTVEGIAPCENASVTLNISVTPFIDAGENSAFTICENDGVVNLFDSLGGTPDAGGTWSPSLNSGTGIFDPSIDPSGTYTYSTSSGAECDDDSATVSVTVQPAPDAGTDGILTLCNANNSIDLFESLGGTPQAGGTWSPALQSGTGEFDPNLDAEGVYTYTLSSICGTGSATVTVSIGEPNDAGTDGSIELCPFEASVDLFNSLGGTPNLGGTWSPELNSGTGIFDPSIDAGGIYTYTVSSTASTCPDASANINVTVLQEPDAGGDAVLNLCNAANLVDLFDSLTGTADAGGTWSPALASGTGVFDPNTDSEGTYTYTVNSTCGTDSSNVTVTFSDLNDAGNDAALELCFNDASVDLFDSLGGTPQLGGAWSPVLNSSSGIFDPSIDSPGIYTYTISNPASLCPDSSATINVSIIEEPNAGNDAILNLCNNTSNVDLFDSLGGNPDTGGTWSPVLSSGSGIFDPTVDAEGPYTYTITTSCGSSSATVTISISEFNDAGSDSSIEICIDDEPVNLFDNLGGTPQLGGTWSPSLNSGTGIFDPSVDTNGVYTYTISNDASPCPDASASVTVAITPQPNAGSNNTLDLCADETTTVNLFDSLGGTPDSGGTWSPMLSSGSGLFNPIEDSEGDYTYTVTTACGSSSAVITVSVFQFNDAGSDGFLELCSNTEIIDLFDSLNGTPQLGGTWSPALNSGTGLFDPNIDAEGIYSYTISNETSPCPEASASVTVTILPPPNAGTDNTLELCTDDTELVDLFDSLGGTPNAGGIWSPTLVSGSGIFDPTIDAPGNYTYSVTSAECNLADEAIITVVINDVPDASGLTLSIDEHICLGDDAVVEISGANQLPNGEYSLVYQLVDELNTSLNVVTITITDGDSSFIIPSDLLVLTGSTSLSIFQLFFLGESCNADTQSINIVEFIIIEAPTPQIIDNGAQLCEEDNPSIASLTESIVDAETIIWYNQPEGGDAYESSELLENGQTYYAAIRTIEGCESDNRLEVTVTLISCIEDIIIPDGFSPNNDAINDVFDILYLEELYPNFKLSIYNRYGNIIYEGDINTSQWDGTWKGKDTILPVGVYFYIIEFNDGEREAVQGRVYLSR